MRIFIDESGSFTGYGGESLSVVGALCIPDGSLRKITDKYLKLRSTLPKQSGEVKGRLLSENDLNKVVQILSQNRAVFEVTAIDVGKHTESGVINYRDQLATDMENRIVRFNEKAQNELRQAIIQIRRTPAPLFLQAMVTMDVLETVLRHIPLYFAQRQPRELGSFRWIVDGKDRTTTNWERWRASVPLDDAVPARPAVSVPHRAGAILIMLPVVARTGANRILAKSPSSA